MIKYKVKVVGTVLDAESSMDAIKIFVIFASEKENYEDIQAHAIVCMIEYLLKFTVLYNSPIRVIRKVEILERISDNENK